MEEMLGLLRLRIRRGRNLVVRDLGSGSSDPFIIVTLGHQKLKTKVVKNNCNPEWNEELTLSIKDPNLPILLTVYDKDTISTDDKMGQVKIDLKPYVAAIRIGAKNLSNGCCIKIVQPTADNCLAEASRITWHDGQLLQGMVLKLQHVDSGEVDVQIEWIDVPGCKGLLARDAEPSFI